MYCMRADEGVWYGQKRAVEKKHLGYWTSKYGGRTAEDTVVRVIKQYKPSAEELEPSVRRGRMPESSGAENRPETDDDVIEVDGPVREAVSEPRRSLEIGEAGLVQISEDTEPEEDAEASQASLSQSASAAGETSENSSLRQR